MEIILALVHLFEAMAAHPLEAGIVVTNIWLARVTFKAIPATERPHRRIVRSAVRRTRRQHRFHLLPLELVMARYHREKFLQAD